MALITFQNFSELNLKVTPCTMCIQTPCMMCIQYRGGYHEYCGGIS